MGKDCRTNPGGYETECSGEVFDLVARIEADSLSRELVVEQDTIAAQPADHNELGLSHFAPCH